MGKNIMAVQGEHFIAVSRDDMCNSEFRGSGIPEEVTYPNVLQAVKANVDCSGVTIFWASKTDDDLFLEVIPRRKPS